MIERGELELEQIKTTFQKMLWKWSNDAWKHKLRIENWPTALKETYPSPGFSLSIITEKDDKKEEKHAQMDTVMAMFKTMQTAYQSPNADDRLEWMRIVSWTDEKMELEDPSNIPIVSCDNGTVLLRALASKGLLTKIKKSKKSSRKRTRATANASSVDDTDDEDALDHVALLQNILLLVSVLSFATAYHLGRTSIQMRYSPADQPLPPL
ncbi:hypothetical protein DFH08DRAFT_955716 [Mycena albidolilacea]|uniref:Uncharacterized protein n=1 Tax=Mycena albidolilacea TaxID=1033008 RepID=A0AAD7AC47_9AGAR|nr:hypothetical protein DFH08DRAFT_955716 [Mycena albidolilacea]